MSHDADVMDTLARLDLLTPGRTPDMDALRYAGIAALFLAPFLLTWKRLGPATFLAPFLIGGTLLFLQNLVTNRHIQSHHFVICLTPCWALVIVMLWQQSKTLARPPIVRRGGRTRAVRRLGDRHRVHAACRRGARRTSAVQLEWIDPTYHRLAESIDAASFYRAVE